MLGFYSKVLIVTAVIAANYLYFALLALGFSLVGVFYCLRLVNVMFFHPAEPLQGSAGVTVGGKILLVSNALLLLVAGAGTALLLPLIAN